MTAEGPTGAPLRHYDCPGIALPQPKGAPPEGYVACYRAGHSCPAKEANVTETETHRTTVYRCPCCGDANSHLRYTDATRFVSPWLPTTPPDTSSVTHSVDPNEKV